MTGSTDEMDDLPMRLSCVTKVLRHDGLIFAKRYTITARSIWHVHSRTHSFNQSTHLTHPFHHEASDFLANISRFVSLAAFYVGQGSKCNQYQHSNYTCSIYISASAEQLEQQYGKRNKHHGPVWQQYDHERNRFIGTNGLSQ